MKFHPSRRSNKRRLTGIIAQANGTSFSRERFSHDLEFGEIIVRDIAATATLLASIAIAIALILLVPKSFGFETSQPIVQGELPTK
ncbi:hypothetical protein EN933_40660 [Mesorhizobium sp. M7A.F.Ca.US.001.01.1.1]|nr:hypothetical protein EN933_40660 [Mesorhizobium sp. M7A.F.Ca.US.001.01.1.1]